MIKSRFGKACLYLLFIALLGGSAWADVYVNGYTRSNGTYVQPHYRSSPNSTPTDNYSYKGNTNPYTGQQGYNSYQQPSYNYTKPTYSNPYNNSTWGD